MQNIGPGPAYDITPKIIEEAGGVEFSKPNEYENPINIDYKNKLMQSLSTRLHELTAFKSGGINYIGPNDKRSFFFWDLSVGNYFSIKHLVADKTVKIEVKYHKYPKKMREGSEKPFTDIYSLDFLYIVELLPRLVRAGPQP